MYSSLAKHLMELPEESVRDVTLEDLAICSAWYDSLAGSPETLAPFAALPNRIATWIAHATTTQDDTHLRRQQPLLRAIVRELLSSHLHALTREELDVLCAAHDLAQRAEDSASFGSLFKRVAPYMADVRNLRSKMDNRPGLPGLTRRLAIFTEDDLRRAEVRDIRVFAGIELPGRLPVLLYSGNAKIVGGIPQDVAVVVEQGSCYVDGKVLGRLAATEFAEVYDDVSGTVIVRRGDVRLRKILNNAVVISKEGSVFAEEAQNPRLVFACRELRLKGDALGGRFFGRQIRVDGAMAGVEVHASESLQAQQIRHSEARNSAIVLCRGLAYDDYGEVLSMEALRLLRGSLAFHQRILGLQALYSLSEREADEYAGNVLLFLLGPDETTERVEHIQALQRRVAYLSRIGNAAHAIILAGEDRLDLLESHTEEEDLMVQPPSFEEQEILNSLQNELSMLALEGRVERDLHEWRETFVRLARQVLRKLATPDEITSSLNALLRLSEECERSRRETAAEIELKEKAIEQALDRAAIIRRARAACARVEVMTQLLAEGRKRGAKDKFRERCNDRHIHLMRRYIEARLSFLAGYRSAIKEAEGKLRRIRERLWEEYQVSLPMHVLDGGMVRQARAVARFAAGIRVCAYRHLLAPSATLGESGKISQDSGDVEVAYVRTAEGAIALEEKPVVPSQPK